MKVFKLLVKNFFLATVITTATMSCRITNNNVTYNSIDFCPQKHPVHSRSWLGQASGEPGPNLSLKSTIRNLKDTVQLGEDKKDLDDSQHLIIKIPRFPAIV